MEIIKSIGVAILAIIFWIFSMAFYGVCIIGSIWLGYKVITWIL